MKTFTIRVSSELNKALNVAACRTQASKAELVRRALLAYLAKGADQGTDTQCPSALVLAGDLVGCFSGGPLDLASNPRHTGGFGERS